ncbi:uncharacterized protein LOC109511935 isoform X2 [Hippocampus comes]|uniref:uncharacterized protein LOC109511935 isoform X2 n=1 Tax=Hippocampus comes TaxID=109280 RepID=UPI00094F2577|nr:PREDICTED: uncharacterized protein LOC109511935 isoform X2 [Hippocampus comes]
MQRFTGDQSSVYFASRSKSPGINSSSAVIHSWDGSGGLAGPDRATAYHHGKQARVMDLIVLSHCALCGTLPRHTPTWETNCHSPKERRSASVSACDVTHQECVFMSAKARLRGDAFNRPGPGKVAMPRKGQRGPQATDTVGTQPSDISTWNSSPPPLLTLCQHQAGPYLQKIPALVRLSNVNPRYIANLQLFVISWVFALPRQVLHLQCSMLCHN